MIKMTTKTLANLYNHPLLNEDYLKTIIDSHQKIKLNKETL